MYVCMYICICIHAYIHTYIHTYILLHEALPSADAAAVMDEEQWNHTEHAGWELVMMMDKVDQATW